MSCAAARAAPVEHQADRAARGMQLAAGQCPRLPNHGPKSGDGCGGVASDHSAASPPRSGSKRATRLRHGMGISATAQPRAAATLDCRVKESPSSQASYMPRAAPQFTQHGHWRDPQPYLNHACARCVGCADGGDVCGWTSAVWWQWRGAGGCDGGRIARALKPMRRAPGIHRSSPSCWRCVPPRIVHKSITLRPHQSTSCLHSSGC